MHQDFDALFYSSTFFSKNSKPFFYLLCSRKRKMWVSVSWTKRRVARFLTEGWKERLSEMEPSYFVVSQCSYFSPALKRMTEQVLVVGCSILLLFLPSFLNWAVYVCASVHTWKNSGFIILINIIFQGETRDFLESGLGSSERWEVRLIWIGDSVGSGGEQAAIYLVFRINQRSKGLKLICWWSLPLQLTLSHLSSSLFNFLSKCLATCILFFYFTLWAFSCGEVIPENKTGGATLLITVCSKSINEYKNTAFPGPSLIPKVKTK